MRLAVRLLVALALAPAGAAVAGPMDTAIEQSRVWRTCVIRHATDYAAQSERAEDLVRAAFGRCTAEEQETRRLFYGAGKGPFGMARPDQAAIEDVMASARKRIEDGAFSAIIDARSTEARPPPPRN